MDKKFKKGDIVVRSEAAREANIDLPNHQPAIVKGYTKDALFTGTVLLEIKSKKGCKWTTTFHESYLEKLEIPRRGDAI